MYHIMNDNEIFFVFQYRDPIIICGTTVLCGLSLVNNINNHTMVGSWTTLNNNKIAI